MLAAVSEAKIVLIVRRSAPSASRGTATRDLKGHERQPEGTLEVGAPLLFWSGLGCLVRCMLHKPSLQKLGCFFDGLGLGQALGEG